ncbi:MAG: hypothetical protein C0506_13590 [Anaerolinea sp.]|nr:hypothetical protein [Anaerolinea sp.]
MKRAILTGLGIVGVVAAAIPAMALAQGFPPPPPTTYYGTATGATSGQGVIAIVTDGSGSTACGDGVVTSDGGSTVFVVDVVADAQKAGCGKAGRQVLFYFTPIGGSSGRVSTSSASWSGPGPAPQNVTLGPALTASKNAAPSLARDGLY